MKKFLLSLLMGLFLSPLQIFADHYPYEELPPDPQPPLRSPVVSQVAFNLDYYTGDLSQHYRCAECRAELYRQSGWLR